MIVNIYPTIIKGRFSQNAKLYKISKTSLKFQDVRFLYFYYYYLWNSSKKKVFLSPLNTNFGEGERNAKSRFLQIGSILVLKFFLLLHECGTKNRKRTHIQEHAFCKLQWETFETEIRSIYSVNWYGIRSRSHCENFDIWLPKVQYICLKDS